MGLKSNLDLLNVFADLVQNLSNARSAKEAAVLMVETADKIIGWDSCSVLHYSSASNLLKYIYRVDIIDESRMEINESPDTNADSRFYRRIIAGNKTLINRGKNTVDDFDVMPFGDKSRLSASLIYVPIRKKNEVVGLLSIQSYKPNFYVESDLETVQALADLCASAFDRIQAEYDLINTHKIYRETIENAGGVPYYLNFDVFKYDFVGGGCEKLFEIPIEQITYKFIKSIVREMIITDSNAPKDISEYAKAFLNGTMDKFEVDLRVELPNGKEKWISDTALPVKDEKSGKVIASIGILQDITWRKRSEKYNRIIADLNRKIALAANAKEAAVIIMEIADDHIGWDSCFIDFYNASDNTVNCILSVDLIDNKRIDCTHDKRVKVEDALIIDILRGESKLILREKGIPVNEEGLPAAFGDDKKRSASLIYVPIKNKEGVTFGILSIQSYKFQAYDQTDLGFLQLLAEQCSGAIERIRIEDELRNTQIIYQKTIENAGGVPYKMSYSKEKYEYMGKGCKELLGIDSEVLTHRMMKDIVQEIVLFDAPADVDITSYEDKFFKGELKRFRADYRILTPDGIEKWVNDCSIPFRNEESGEIIGSLGILQDITERKKNEKEIESLRMLAHRLTSPQTLREVALVLAEESRKMFEHDAFFLTYYDRVNNMAVGIYSEDTAEYEKKPKEHPSLSFALNKYSLTQTYQGISSLYNRETPDYAGFIPTGEKERKSRSLMFAPIIWGEKTIGDISIQSYTLNKYSKVDLALLETFASHASGAVIRVVAQEERLKIEEKMLHTQKLESLGILAGGIAHDFNNLLMGILGNADLALLELNAASPVVSNIKEIEKASRRAADLCKQLLAYSGKGKFVVKAMKINEIVKEMAHLLEITISKGISLQYDFEEDIPAIEGDPTQIRQVIMNLITNASEAIGDKSGLIRIRVGSMMCEKTYFMTTFLTEELQPGKYVYIEVSDTGAGMEEKVKERIFDPFFTTKFTGRGLGLAAVLGIVRGHKGAIKIYSEKGKGSTFKIIFPAVEKKADIDSYYKDITKEWRGEGTILIIDDEEFVRNIGKQMLQKFGFNVLTACDGVEGVEVFKNNKDSINIVLLDLVMPNMGGEECFDELIKIKNDLKVVITSGYNEKDVMSKFTGKKSAGFIQKPFQSKELIRMIRIILI